MPPPQRCGSCILGSWGWPQTDQHCQVMHPRFCQVSWNVAKYSAFWCFGLQYLTWNNNNNNKKKKKTKKIWHLVTLVRADPAAERCELICFIAKYPFHILFWCLAQHGLCPPWHSWLMQREGNNEKGNMKRKKKSRYSRMPSLPLNHYSIIISSPSSLQHSATSPWQIQFTTTPGSPTYLGQRAPLPPPSLVAPMLCRRHDLRLLTLGWTNPAPVEVVGNIATFGRFTVSYHINFINWCRIAAISSVQTILDPQVTHTYEITSNQ